MPVNNGEERGSYDVFSVPFFMERAKEHGGLTIIQSFPFLFVNSGQRHERCSIQGSYSPKQIDFGFGYIIIRSPYTPYFIYLRGTMDCYMLSLSFSFHSRFVEAAKASGFSGLRG